VRRLTIDELGRWRRQVVRVCEGNLGYGESEGNNRGPFLRAIGAPDGANWCAYFASYALLRAFEYAELPAPFKRSGSAKTLGKRVAACAGGWWSTDPLEALPGDLVILHRGDLPVRETGPGHVRVVTARVPGTALLRQVEGNAGAFPAVVRWRESDVTRDPRFMRIVGLR
jgi:hypothetical protein